MQHYGTLSDSEHISVITTKIAQLKFNNLIHQGNFKTFVNSCWTLHENT